MSKRKVMITLDDSSLSQQIIPVVQKLFAPQDTELLLFTAMTPQLAPELAEGANSLSIGDALAATVIHTDSLYHHQLEMRAELNREVQQALAAQRARELRRIGRPFEDMGFVVTAEAWTGNAAETISMYARHKKVDLIAMATHGRSGLSRLMLGSVAEEVVRISPIPVLLVRPEAE